MRWLLMELWWNHVSLPLIHCRHHFNWKGWSFLRLSSLIGLSPSVQGPGPCPLPHSSPRMTRDRGTEVVIMPSWCLLFDGLYFHHLQNTWVGFKHGQFILSPCLNFALCLQIFSISWLWWLLTPVELKWYLWPLCNGISYFKMFSVYTE